MFPNTAHSRTGINRMVPTKQPMNRMRHPHDLYDWFLPQHRVCITSRFILSSPFTNISPVSIKPKQQHFDFRYIISEKRTSINTKSLSFSSMTHLKMARSPSSIVRSPCSNSIESHDRN